MKIADVLNLTIGYLENTHTAYQNAKNLQYEFCANLHTSRVSLQAHTRAFLYGTETNTDITIFFHRLCVYREMLRSNEFSMKEPE